ncbi:aspartic proteinase CDR1 [Quercus suber]|nr:aspartic proteinase CDR1-like [Quercus suber]POE68501.1 aspartic proteinase cdr1 [Quercus suber]
MALQIQAVTLCGHNVYLEMPASNSFIPCSILKSPPRTTKFLVTQKNVLYYWMKPVVLLKIFAITRLDMLLVCPKVFGPKKKLTISSTSGQAVSFDIAFGCAHNTGGFHYEGHATRITGLGAGPSSFVSQIGSKRFSYCLVPYGIDPSITSKISFGNDTEVMADGVVSTPYVGGDQYYLTLEGISVGDTYLPFNSSGRVSKGNICMDSRSPPLTLPLDFYDRLVVEVKKQILIDPIKNDNLLGTRLCYITKITNENGPILTVHFEGADVELKPIQTFNQLVKEYEYYCFAITNIANT